MTIPVNRKLKGRGEKIALTAWDGEAVDLLAWSEDFDQRRRLENRRQWRRHYFDMARIHYSLAEENCKKAFAFGAEEEINGHKSGQTEETQ